MAGVRRSGRISKQVPIVLLGTDTSGRVFSEETHTLVLSLHGAGIRSRNKFAPGESPPCASPIPAAKPTSVSSAVSVKTAAVTFTESPSAIRTSSLFGLRQRVSGFVLTKPELKTPPPLRCNVRLSRPVLGIPGICHPERPRFSLRAEFWRAGPRSGGTSLRFRRSVRLPPFAILAFPNPASCCTISAP